MAVLIAVLYLGVTQLNAQTKEVTGRVTDPKDVPIAGATIKAKGYNNSTTTNADGFFTLQVNTKAKFLEISYVGFSQQDVAIGSGQVTATLKEADRSLTEVVVVGYGTKIKKDITGSVARVSAKEIGNTPTTSFESALQGRAAGVLVSQQNGKLGQGINIRIRGASSVSAGNEPLYVVDGIPLTTDDLSSTSAPTNALADLNMNDIESVEILKDASAAAIYGSRGSNGVVLITTKKGKAGQSKIEFGYFTGTQKPTGKREFLNAKQYVDYFTRAAIGAATQDSIYYGGSLAENLKAEVDSVNSRFKKFSAGTDDWKTGNINTNWQDQVFQKAPISQYDLNISGGSDKTRFFISGQYLDQKGIIIGNAYKRYSGRINVDHQVKEWLNIGMNMNFSRSLNNRISNDNAFSTPLQIIALSPITPLIDPRTGLASGALDPATGRPNTNFPVYYNPLLSVDNAFYLTTVNRNIGNVYANASITKHLGFRTELGIDQLNQTEENYYGKITARNTGVPNGSGFYGSKSVLNLNTNNYFNFKQTFNNRHDVEAILGMSYQDRKYESGSASAEQFPSDAYKKLASAASKTDATSSASTSTLVSYFARANYKLDDKYIIAVSGRIDGSSRFGANHKYGFFPAASAGWIISKEHFLENSKFLSFLKLKASYGVTGNESIGDFESRPLYTGTGGAYGGQAGQIPSQLGNPNLKWETTLGSDFGIEGAVFNNRVSFEVDYYQRNTNDLLLSVQVPGTTGFASQLQNIGKLNNKGIEFTVNTTNIATKNLRWTTTLNFGANKNKIVYLQGQEIGTDVNKAKEGEPLGVFYAREYAGVDAANGDALYYKNVKGTNGVIDRSTTNDYNVAQDVRIGNPNPKFIYGFGNNVTFKTIDLDVLLQGVYGNQLYNGGGQYMSASGSNGFDNQTTDQLAAWQKPGDITNVPEARLFYSNGTNPSSRYISTGSYLRVKAVTLGFNLPKSITSKLKIDRVRAYVRAQNLFTITKYKGWDPEVNADYQANNINQGVDFYSAPQIKSFVVGINIGL